MRDTHATAEPLQLELPGHELRPSALSAQMPARGCDRLLLFRCTACSSTTRIGARCPSVCGRCPWRSRTRAASTLQLLPRVPVRHWVFRPAPPDHHRLEDREVLRKAARLFVGEVFETVRRLTPVPLRRDGQIVCGAVSLVHPANAALEPDIHLHALVLDGVYDWSRGEPVFVPLGDAPTSAALGDLTRRLQTGLRRIFRARPTPAQATQLAQRVVEGPPVRKVRAQMSEPERASPASARRAGLGAIRDGLQVFASGVIASDDRPALARLTRYLTRPIPDPDAFSQTPAGPLRYRLHHPFADGTTHVELEPETLAQRLAALAPDGLRGDVSLHGVLAARAAKRWRIMPGQLRLFEQGERQPPTSVPSQRAKPKSPIASKEPRVPDPCRECGGNMQLIAIEAVGAPQLPLTLPVPVGDPP